MRIDMTIMLRKDHDFYVWDRLGEGWCSIQLTTEQAKALRDQITKHLRGVNRDKEDGKVDA